MKRFLCVLLACALSTMAVPAFALESDSNQTESPGLEQPLSKNTEESTQPSDNPNEGERTGDSTKDAAPTGDQADEASPTVVQAEEAGQANNAPSTDVQAEAHYANVENPQEALRSTLPFDENKGGSGTLVIGNASQTVCYDEYYTVRMKGGINQTSNAIEIITPNLKDSYGSDAFVGLQNVNIDTSSLANTPAVRIAEGAGAIAVRTEGETTLASSKGCAGIQKDNGAKGTLAVSGAQGSVLRATGGKYGAGIGSGVATEGNCEVQDITVDSYGTVEATGSSSAAGIGTGRAINGNTKASYITIKNGTVKATGGHAGSGVGSGVAGKDDRGGTSEAGFITIEGGDLQAQGGRYAAGIGAGASVNMKSWAHDITVNGGTVKAAGAIRPRASALAGRARPRTPSTLCSPAAACRPRAATLQASAAAM